MATGLNQRAIQRLKRLTESLDNINKFLARLKTEDLEELIRRDMIGVDTFASSHTGSSIVASNRGASPELTPTERAAELRGFDKKQRDPVREEIKRIERNVFKAEDTIRSAVESMAFLKEGVERKRGRDVSTPCEVCQVLPITRRGMCNECHLDWIDAGCPDFGRWVAYITARRNSEGQILVHSQPPAKYAPQTLDNSQKA